MFSNLKGEITHKFIDKFFRKNNIVPLHTINRGDQFDINRQYIQDELVDNSRFLRFIANENDKKVFGKIALNRKGKKDLKRQVFITEYLTDQAKVHTPRLITKHIKNYHFVKYTSFEYLPLSKKGGFYYNAEYNEIQSRIKYKNLKQDHIDLLIKELVRLTCTPRYDVPKKIKIKKTIDLKEIDDIFHDWLKVKVKPLDYQDESMTINTLISKRLKIDDFEKSLNILLVSLKNKLEKYDDLDEKYLVHGDCDFNNIYYFSEDKLCFIDFEFLGYTKSPLWSCAYDYGNLRVRQWGDHKFRMNLDRSLLKHFKDMGEEELGKLILTFSILKPCLTFPKYYENYEYEKQSIEYQKIRKSEIINDLKLVWDLWDNFELI